MIELRRQTLYQVEAQQVSLVQGVWHPHLDCLEVKVDQHRYPGGESGRSGSTLGNIPRGANANKNAKNLSKGGLS